MDEVLLQILAELKDLRQEQERQGKSQVLIEKEVHEIRKNNDKAARVKIEESLAALHSGMKCLESDLAEIKEDIETIKDDCEITRSGTNRLLDWAERTERIVNVPLYTEAE